MENNRYVKANFTDSKGKEAKELIQTFQDSDPGDLLIVFEKQLIKLGACYEIFKEGKWEVLGQLGGRSLGGHIEWYWSDIVKGATNHATGNSAA
jgi:hypothetical protein